jgi:hypothetical protein
VRARMMKLIRRTALLLAVIVVTLLAARVYDSQRGAPLVSGTPKPLMAPIGLIISRLKTRFSRR